MYHRIGPKGKYATPTPLFEEHLAYLRDHPIVLPGESFSCRSISYCITFDDAFYDFYHVVYPLLQQYRIRALLAVPTGYIVEDTQNTPEERLRIPYHLAMQEGIFEKHVPFCTWKELQEMSNSQYVSIASHSHWHSNLTFPFVKRHKEIVESKMLLESKLQQSVDSFVYPFGRWNPEVDREVASHYTYRFRIGEGINFSWQGQPLLRVGADRASIYELLSLPRRIRYAIKGIGTAWNYLRQRLVS